MNQYTQDELRLLRELYPTTPGAELAKYFPGHSVAGIVSTAQKMGLRKSRTRLAAQRSEANSLPIIIRYDDGRVRIARSRREAAKILGTHHSTVSKRLGHYLPSRGCRLIEDTAVGYGAWRKEYRAHPGIDAMPHPLEEIAKIEARVSSESEA